MPRYTETRIPKQSDGYSEWYHAVVVAGQIAKNSPVPGCQILEENGADLWMRIQIQFDPLIRELGYRNKSWPALIPMSIFDKEKEHVDGFGPELAKITHLKGRPLPDPLTLRPTSETPIYADMSGTIRSIKDLPIFWNQWCNVWRVEVRTKLLLRTFEFLWHEAHWAIADKDDALAHTLAALGQYARFCTEDLAIPVIPGEKSSIERFAGAERTYTIEARMQDGKALQAGTSHLMEQGFAEAYGIAYQQGTNDPVPPFTGSWGMSTRIMGAIVMTHSDDRGLILPPRIAPFQLVVINIINGSGTATAKHQEELCEINHLLERAGVRYTVDDTEERIGRKQYHWEKQGVPIRLILGNMELQDRCATIVRRDTGERYKMPFEQLADDIPRLLDEIQGNLFQRARDRLKSNLFEVANLAEFQQLVGSGKNIFAAVGWCDDQDAEEMLKEKYGYTIRCFPLHPETEFDRCFLTGRTARRQAIVAKSY